MPITILRATTPANLGDNQHWTVHAVRINPSGLPGTSLPNPAGGDIECIADGLQDLTIAAVITSVRFRAICSSPENQPVGAFFSNLRMGWTVGAASAVVAATRDAGSEDGQIVKLDAGGLGTGDIASPSYYVSTAQITTQPNGQLWTVAAINAITFPKALFAYAAGVEWIDLDGREIFAEVTTQARAGLVAEVGAVVGSGELSPAVRSRAEVGPRNARGELSPPAKSRVDIGPKAAQGALSPPVQARIELGAAIARGELSPSIRARVEIGAKTARGELSPPVKTRLDIGALVVSGDIEGV